MIDLRGIAISVSTILVRLESVSDTFPFIISYSILSGPLIQSVLVALIGFDGPPGLKFILLHRDVIVFSCPSVEQ